MQQAPTALTVTRRQPLDGSAVGASPSNIGENFMTKQYIVFTNAGGSITALPLNKTSKNERKLILESGGQIKMEADLSGDEQFPRGGKPQAEEE